VVDSPQKRKGFTPDKVREVSGDSLHHSEEQRNR
jgi:hypothetical protein